MKQRRASKYINIAGMLEERVQRGDYKLRRLPSENELAEETGVSRMTARKAMVHLIEKGILVRRAYGRLELAGEQDGRRIGHQFAFLMPPVISVDVQAWQWAVEEVAAGEGGILRPVVFTDWNDVFVADALNGFDGVFLMQTGVSIPPDAVEMLGRSECPVVSLDLDLSAHGIPSIYLYPEKAVWKLLDHVRKQGHRRIACFNTAVMNTVFRRRFDYWQAWKKKRGCAGALYNMPGTDSAIDYAALQAREAFGRLLDEKEFADTAVLCTNVWTALGVAKAMEQRGLQVGKAISVCTINDEVLGPWFKPSLTALQMPDIEAMLTRCVKWMMSGGRNWRGAKLMTPKDVPLYEGDSTGPVTGNRKEKQ